MSCMQNPVAFSANIRELSLDELNFVSGGFILENSENSDTWDPWADCLLGQRGINWGKVLNDAIIGAVAGGVGGAVGGCLVGAAASAPIGGAGCVPTAGAAGAAGLVGGAVTGAITSVMQQSSSPSVR